MALTSPSVGSWRRLESARPHSLSAATERVRNSVFMIFSRSAPIATSLPAVSRLPGRTCDARNVRVAESRPAKSMVATFLSLMDSGDSRSRILVIVSELELAVWSMQFTAP